MFYKKSIVSKINNAGGPSAEEQLESMANGSYWRVLGQKIYSDLETYHTDKKLCTRVNALKHGLQVYGPYDSRLIDCRQNKGIKNSVYHGHVNNSNGTTYVLEWAIIDPKKRILALIGFGTHENFDFTKKALTKTEIDDILKDPDNVLHMKKVDEKIHNAKQKEARIKKSGLSFRC